MSIALEAPLRKLPSDEFMSADDLNDIRPTMQVTLIPKSINSGIDSIFIDNAGLLVSRDTGLFAGYRERFPNKVKFLSRRHAHLFCKNEQLYLKDLGSRNGTQIGDQKIEAHKEFPLQNGDIVTFGCEFFTYTVKLTQTSVMETCLTNAFNAANHRHDESVANKTIYIHAAEHFLDVFYDQKDAENVNELSTVRQPDQDSATGAAGRKKRYTRRHHPLRKLNLFSHELKEALGENQPRNRRWYWLIGISGCLVLAAGVGTYLANAPKWEIKTLLEQGKYQQSFIQAHRYVHRHPDDTEVTALATEALLKAVVPVWTQHLHAMQFTANETLLSNARKRSQANPESLKILELLEWIGDLERFVSERGGLNAPLDMFKHKTTIDSLLERWDTAANTYDLMSVKIAYYLPKFEVIRSQVSSKLRRLRSEKATYFQAIAELKQTVSEQLAAGHGNQAIAQLRQFKKQYPGISGTDRLSDDISHLTMLQQAVKNNSLSEVLRLHRTKYATSLVATQAADWIATQLPPPESLARYQAALAAWQAGEVNHASTLLQPLTQQIWGEMAKAKIAHFHAIAQDFQKLRETRHGADYGERLMAFHNALDTTEDSFYLKAIIDDVHRYRKSALAIAQTAFQQARDHWSEYRRAGGIDGLLRLEQTVSESFREQSQRISETYRLIARGARVYELLDSQFSEPDQKIYNQVMAEIKRQRQWLSDLGLVLDPALLEAKLSLLPKEED